MCQGWTRVSSPESGIQFPVAPTCFFHVHTWLFFDALALWRAHRASILVAASRTLDQSCFSFDASTSSFVHSSLCPAHPSLFYDASAFFFVAAALSSVAAALVSVAPARSAVASTFLAGASTFLAVASTPSAVASMLLADAPTRSAAPCKRSSDHWSPLDDAIIFLFSAPMFKADASCFSDSAAKVFGGAIRISVDAPIFLFSASSCCSPTPGFSSGAPSLCSRAPRSSTPRHARRAARPVGTRQRASPASVPGRLCRGRLAWGATMLRRAAAPASDALAPVLEDTLNQFPPPSLAVRPGARRAERRSVHESS